MTHYVEYVFSDTASLNKGFTKLHKALFDLNNKEVGVSFPRYGYLLGRIVRVHGTKEQLEALRETGWFLGTGCDAYNIKETPSHSYAVFSRVQTNMSESKLRRLIRRGTITNEEAKEYRGLLKRRDICLPYIELKSTSTGELYRRYIKKTEKQERQAGVFDDFGLSKTATVPIW